MVTHWESSKRSLYIKTVWKDGQHHVLLNRNETPERLRKKSTFRNKNNKNNRPIKSAPTNVSNFKVSSVRLVDNERNNIKRRCTTTIKNSNKPPKLCYKISSPKEEKYIPLSIDSNPIDMDYKEKYTINRDTCLNLTNYEEPHTNSLTERVLMWLDLATQNPNNYTKTINLDPPIEINSVVPINKKRQIFAKQRCFSSYHANCQFEADKFSFQIEGTSQALQTLNNTKNNNKLLEEDTCTTNNDDNITNIKNNEIISSCLEENLNLEEQNVNVIKEAKRKFGVKRQLHIFLPDLQKKIGVCDSDLSSQFSNCSIQKTDNSREI